MSWIKLVDTHKLPDTSHTRGYYSATVVPLVRTLLGGSGGSGGWQPTPLLTRRTTVGVVNCPAGWSFLRLTHITSTLL